MRLALLAVLLAALVVLLMPGDVRAQQYEPFACPSELASLTFPEPRVCVETQSWWMQGNTSFSTPQASFAANSTHVHGMVPYPLGERFVVPSPGSGYTWYFLAQYHNDVGGVSRGVRGLGFQDIGGFGCCIYAAGGKFPITQNDQRFAGTIQLPPNRPDAWRYAEATNPRTVESRFTVDTTSRFGKRQYNSTRWFTQLGIPGQPVIVRSRGWYQSDAVTLEYVDVTLTTKVRASTLANGTAIFPGKTLTYTIGSGAKWGSAYIDPQLHCGCPEARGQVLFESRLASSGSFVVPPLSAGVHVLMLVGWEKGSTGWSAGVIRLPFRVN